jgi:hypothetical protein
VQANKRQRGEAFVSTWVFVAGYMLVWALSGAAAYAGALAAEAIATRAALSSATAARIGGALLVVAGLYQFTPFKDLCLSKCRTPIGFIMTSWRDGAAGALRMGLLHGGYCLGCCWLLFVILFPLGIMNLAAMAVITLVVFAEKTLPWGRPVAGTTAALPQRWICQTCRCPGTPPRAGQGRDSPVAGVAMRPSTGPPLLPDCAALFLPAEVQRHGAAGAERLLRVSAIAGVVFVPPTGIILPEGGAADARCSIEPDRGGSDHARSDPRRRCVARAGCAAARDTGCRAGDRRQPVLGCSRDLRGYRAHERTVAVMLTDWQWGLVALCLVIAFGSVVAGIFTLLRLFEHRQQRLGRKDRDPRVATW